MNKLKAQNSKLKSHISSQKNELTELRSQLELAKKEAAIQKSVSDSLQAQLSAYAEVRRKRTV